MSFQLWMGFVAASLVIGLVPGPAVLNIVGYAVGSGRKAALAAVAGTSLGSLAAMTLSLAGVGALLAASALAFAVLKWAGALYLIGLGIVTLIKRDAVPTGEDVVSVPISPRVAFAGSVGIGTFHPKTIVFFVAFAPQFINAQGSYAVQSAILIATFGLVVGCTDTMYALVASRASQLLKGPRGARWSRRAGGGVLIAAGVATAAARN